MVAWYRLKIPSLGINVRHREATLVIPSSYRGDRILTTIKDFYSLIAEPENDVHFKMSVTNNLSCAELFFAL